MFNQAVNAAGEYIGNAIQEMLVVKKEAEHPRVLPSLQHMKIVSNFEYDDVYIMQYIHGSQLTWIGKFQ